MGVVYRVHHLGLQKPFALKVIATVDDVFRVRFRGEAETLGKLQHPNIVQVTDFGIDPREGGLPYLVMEYLEGSTLADRFRGRGRLPIEEALPVFQAIAEAVDYAHARGVLHLDLKPANVFLADSKSSRPIVKILDFGLARLVSDPSSRRYAAGHEEAPPPQPAAQTAAEHSIEGVDGIHCPACGSRKSAGSSPDDPCPVCLLQWGLSSGFPSAVDDDSLPTDSFDGEQRSAVPGPPSQQQFAGTLAYMAPEVLRGNRPTAAADIYAFGILIYEVLAGRRPFQGSDSEVVNGQFSGAPLPPSTLGAGLPRELDAALLPSLAKVPSDRPDRASDVVQHLRSALFRARVRTWRQREIPRRIGIAVAAAAVLLLVSPPAWRLGVLQQMESRSIDARFLARPSRPPDPRLILVSLDESSLAADPTPLPDKADDFGRQLQRVFEAGARGVAIDFLLPETWSRSRAFSDLVLRNPDALTLAALSSPDGEVIGPECLNPLTAAALGPTRASNLFAFVNVDEDPDGVVRRGRLGYRDTSGTPRDTWARRAVRSLQESSRVGSSPDATFLIDHSVDWRGFRRISWKDLIPALEREPDLFRDRLVLVGGEFVGFGGDYHRVPGRIESPEAVSGLALHALIANTILSGIPVREVAPATLVLGMGASVTPLMLAFLSIRRWQVPALLVVLLVPAYVGASFVIFRSTQVLLPIVGPLLTAAGAIVLAILLRMALPAFPEPET
jgi:serine/threonine protein kinase